MRVFKAKETSVNIMHAENLFNMYIINKIKHMEYRYTFYTYKMLYIYSICSIYIIKSSTYIIYIEYRNNFCNIYRMIKKKITKLHTGP